MLCHACLIFITLCVIFSEGQEFASIQRNTPRKFPDGFQFGAATSSYQVEGAWDVDGKGRNIWDHQTHLNPSPIEDASNGDDAGKSYYLYERDVEMLREIGVDFYRFSLSWSRILPTAFPNEINQAGLDYYNRLIDELLKYNIEPMITIYHWDLPQKLQELGGWSNPHSVDWFGDFARIAFNAFGDRVKYWVTVNEPTQICYNGYGNGALAPFYTYSGAADYMCAKYLLLAHARAYHIYDEEFRSSQKGSIFITFSAVWFEPASEDDIVAAQEARVFDLE
ncbi:hypothetical protein evm_008630 [Chilo suppressalis]|nr:hypothetical protein evm_008630 [Chilo suppressalis]